MFFLSTMRPIIQKANPTLNKSDLFKKIISDWKELDLSSKEKY